MLRARWFPPLVAMLLAAGGCARHRTGTAPAVKLTEPVTLEIENHNWADVIVYIVREGRSTRFAQVAAGKSATTEIPPRLLGSQGIFRFSLHRIGGRDDYLTESVSIATGYTVRLTVESQLDKSSVGVW